MKKKVFQIMATTAFLCVVFACSEQDLFAQCIECQGIKQVCEGDEDGNGGVITQADLENGLADGTYSQSCQIVIN
ncbi:MAG: hypothetical protein ACI9L9_000869 [Marivirga sp.]|jgi:hypothetical protein